jgi:N-acetylglucosaminyl-diphospho-decaprenol L-rhamnosyltransferase
VSLTLSVIIVSYNVRDLLCRCLETVQAELAGLNTEILVVDNASSDGTVDAIHEHFPVVRVIANDRNPGFAAANNQALEIATGQTVLFLNPDTELRPGALTAMLEYLANHPRVGIVGPRLQFPDGSVQSSRRSFPTPLTGLVESTPIQRWLPGLPPLRRYYRANESDDQCQYVDWLVGACLLVRREVIDAIGGFDERFFMYSEELDWCYRAQGAGWRIVYLPSAVVTHHEGRSSEQNRIQRSQNFLESKSRLYEKHFGADVGRALRLCLLAFTIVEAVAEFGKLLVGHRVALRRERLHSHFLVASHQLRHLVGYRYQPDSHDTIAAQRTQRSF